MRPLSGRRPDSRLPLRTLRNRAGSPLSWAVHEPSPLAGATLEMGSELLDCRSRRRVKPSGFLLPDGRQSNRVADNAATWLLGLSRGSQGEDSFDDRVSILLPDAR